MVNLLKTGGFNQFSEGVAKLLFYSILLFFYFALLHKNNQHVHPLIGCSKKKSKKKKIRPTYPISKKSVTENIQFFFRPNIVLGIKTDPYRKVAC